ncbi:hypothetical protein PG991_010635 [Apiospora marii]|uniref:Uncharacterized protein n=1 Tax=Apiospora marii TaxID=335849 RepID=A0ABR1RBY5_9PEZI
MVGWGTLAIGLVDCVTGAFAEGFNDSVVEVTPDGVGCAGLLDEAGGSVPNRLGAAGCEGLPDGADVLVNWWVNMEGCGGLVDAAGEAPKMLDVAGCGALKMLDLEGCGAPKMLDVEGFGAPNMLDVEGFGAPKILDVAGCGGLLDAAGEALKMLDVAGCGGLPDAAGEALKMLDVPGCGGLLDTAGETTKMLDVAACDGLLDDIGFDSPTKSLLEVVSVTWAGLHAVAGVVVAAVNGKMAAELPGEEVTVFGSPWIAILGCGTFVEVTEAVGTEVPDDDAAGLAASGFTSCAAKSSRSDLILAWKTFTTWVMLS